MVLKSELVTHELPEEEEEEAHPDLGSTTALTSNSDGLMAPSSGQNTTMHHPLLLTKNNLTLLLCVCVHVHVGVSS